MRGERRNIKKWGALTAAVVLSLMCSSFALAEHNEDKDSEYAYKTVTVYSNGRGIKDDVTTSISTSSKVKATGESQSGQSSWTSYYYTVTTTDTHTLSLDYDEIKSEVGTTEVAGANDSISVTSVTDSNNKTTYTVTAKQSSVKSEDTGIVTGGDAYSELRSGASGTYIHEASTTAANLSALDTKIGAAKGVTGLYEATVAVEDQIQAVGNKTIQSITNAVSNSTGDTQKITVQTYDGIKTNIEIAGQGAVASGDVRLLNGNAVYTEVRPTDGNYIKQGNTTATNLTVLDTQVKTNADDIISLGGRLNTLSGEVHRIGASAAALAALRPETFDPGDKWSFAVGYGHYKNTNAGALGIFYKPNAETTFSLGGVIGYDDALMNAGISFKLGSRGKKTGTYRDVKDLVARIDAIEAAGTKRDAVIAAQAKELAIVKTNCAKELAALRVDNEKIKADNEKMKKQIVKILSKMEMSGTVKKAAK